MTVALREAIPGSVIMTRLFGRIVVPPECIIHFPEGIPGFPDANGFALLPAVAPALRWLQSLDEPALAFLLVQWSEVGDEPIDLGPGDIYAIVTLPMAGQGATVNLQAPLFIRPQARVGRQVIRTDAVPGTAIPIDLEALSRTP